MSLQKEGFRFLVCPSKIVGKWAHNAEAAHYIANGWTDCSGMTDEEFNAFMGTTQEKAA